ncbi:MAG: HD domain-containing protein [Erysipelotrichaceae bacterium]|nr:HD domain-containing protein [Erysipelotrichaceae bacterium]
MDRSPGNEKFQKCAEAFAGYTRQFDTEDLQIALKIKHTWKVVKVMEELCEALNLDEKTALEARLTALLHDAGRFEQVARWHTFLDAKSDDHAKLSVKVIKEQGFLKEFPKEVQDRILKAVFWHNKLAVPSDLSPEEDLLARLIRDADKTDIFRVFAQESVQAAAESTVEEIAKMEVTPKVFEEFMSNHSIDKADRRNALDIWVSILAFFYDMNFACSVQKARSQKYYREHFDSTKFENPKTARQMREMLDHLERYLDEKMEGKS